MAKNSNLHSAKAAKNDEFYTRLQDIENELYHYWYDRPETFKDKVVLCNCDDPNHSNFWVYFHKRYKELGLAGLIAIHYSVSEKAYVKTYTGGDDYNIESGVVTYLQGDGDFRSPECIEILKMSDIVVTNPPFSLFREYITQLMEYNKKFIIVGNMISLSIYGAFMLTITKPFMQPSIIGYNLFIIAYVIAESVGAYVIIYGLIWLIKKIVKICKKKFENNRL